MSHTASLHQSSESHTEYSVTHAVVERVADAKGVDPLDLTTPLATVIDPDALETFVESAADERIPADPCVEFTYSGFRVSVLPNGAVDVSER